MSAPQVKVCVVGSLNMDLVVRCPRLPAHGETILGGAYRTYPGGKGANQAVAAARYGAKVMMIGAVGDDSHGPKLRQTLEADGVDCTHLQTRPGQSTGLGLITVADGGENTIVVASGANATLTEADIDAAGDVVRGSDVLLMQLEVPHQANIAAAAMARKAGRVVVLNAAPARPVPGPLLELVDLLIVNRSEAARLLSIDLHTDPARLQVRLPELGPVAVVMTLGAMGCIISHRGRPRRVNSPSVEALDSTGAGDAFTGVLAVEWVDVCRAAARSGDEARRMEQALRIASAAGALAATKHGAIPSLPLRAQIEELAARPA